MVDETEMPAFPGGRGQGLHFTNDEWNDSIANGDAFTLRWNESLDSSADLALYKVSFPGDGLVGYELVSNLSDSVNDASCVWTPDDLDDDLYALWLTADGDENAHFAVSPPWMPKKTPKNTAHWAAPIIVPIVTVLAIYLICLTICMAYRRRRRARLAAGRPEHGHDHAPLVTRRSSLPSPQDVDESQRHPSVDSVVTVQTLEDADGMVKPGVWLVTHTSTPAETPCTSPTAAEPLLSGVEAAHVRL